MLNEFHKSLVLIKGLVFSLRNLQNQYMENELPSLVRGQPLTVSLSKPLHSHNFPRVTGVLGSILSTYCVTREILPVKRMCKPHLNQDYFLLRQVNRGFRIAIAGLAAHIHTDTITTLLTTMFSF